MSLQASTMASTSTSTSAGRFELGPKESKMVSADRERLYTRETWMTWELDLRMGLAGKLEGEIKTLEK